MKKILFVSTRNPFSNRYSGDVLGSKKIINLLDGEKGPYRDIVLLNSAAALYVDGKVENLKDGISLSENSIDNGKAKIALKNLIRISNS